MAPSRTSQGRLTTSKMRNGRGVMGSGLSKICGEQVARNGAGPIRDLHVDLANGSGHRAEARTWPARADARHFHAWPDASTFGWCETRARAAILENARSQSTNRVFEKAGARRC